VNQAIVDFSRAIEFKTNYPRAYNNRGNAYLRQGEIRRAWADFERAGRRPRRVLMWLAGVALLVLGLTVAAAFALRRPGDQPAE
jgi:Flp pilus assembly protein TadD